MDCGDIDADGMDELFGSGESTYISAFDVDLQQLQYAFPTNDVSCFKLIELDGWGAPELVVGKKTPGIEIWETAGRLMERRYVGGGRQATRVCAGDGDGDGRLEVYWGSGSRSTSPDFLHSFDYSLRDLDWESTHFVAPLVGPVIGDLDADGSLEVVCTSWTTGYEGGRLLVFDGQTGELLDLSPPFAEGRIARDVFDLKLRNLDEDPNLEVLVATDYSSQGLIEAYRWTRATGFELCWKNATHPDGSAFHGVDAADIDGDGVVEIVASSGRKDSGADGVRVYVYDFETGQEEWRSQDLSSSFWQETGGIEIADLDGDGDLEFFTFVWAGDLWIFDGATKQVDQVFPGPIHHFALFRGTTPPVLVLSSMDSLEFLQHENGQLVEQRRAGFDWLDGLSIGPDGAIWTAKDGVLSVYRAGSATLWGQTLDFGAGFGKQVAFHPLTNLVFSAGMAGLHGFRIN